MTAAEAISILNGSEVMVLNRNPDKFAAAFNRAILALDSERQSRHGNRWISVTERMPEEHESLFSKFAGTELWAPGMFVTTSDTVLAAVEFEDGSRAVKAVSTCDGKWNLKNTYRAKAVTHWMPLPDLPREE